MLDLAYLDRCDALLHRSPQVVKTYRSTNLIILLEDILEIRPYPSFNIRRDLDEILAINYSA